MSGSKFRIVLVASLTLVLLASSVALAETGNDKDPLKEGMEYMKDIKAGLENIKGDMKTFSKSNNKDSFAEDIKKLEDLVDRAQSYQDESRKILASTLQLKMKGLKNSLSQLSDPFVHSFEESLVDMAERYNELARTWHEMLFNYKQNAEKLAESVLLVSDEATEIMDDFLQKAKQKMNSGEEN